MSTDDNKAAVRRFHETVVNRHDVEAARAFFAEDFVDHTPVAPDMPPGFEGFRIVYMEFIAAFPDLAIEAIEMVAEGDLVSVRYVLTGTNTGPFMGHPPTGRPICVGGLELVRVVDGMFREHWEYFDLTGLLMQLGRPPV